MSVQSGTPNHAELSHVQQALEATYDPRTSSEVRQQARRYLENVSSQSGAIETGITLARDTALPAQTRHFGLSIIHTNFVRHWDEPSYNQINTYRQWMIDLVGQMSKDEAGYIRSKVASLWIELSKRCWGDAWVDLDELLQQIWTISETDARYINYKIFVLYVLECLSDDICVRDDPVALLRQEILGQSLNEIMISPKLYDKHREEREGGTDMRFADEGWMLRICRLLSHLVESISGKQTEYSPMIIAALEALKPTVNWISLEAIIETDCVNCIFQTLEIDDEKIRLACIELLHGILGRPYSQHFHESWISIYRQSCHPSRIELYKSVYEAAATDPDDLDDGKYVLQQKLSEVLAYLGNGAMRFLDLLDDQAHANSLYSLLVEVFHNNSLLVSIPVLHTLAMSLESRQERIMQILNQALNLLMDTCLVRLIKFESLPKHTKHPILTYLHDDFETQPELHAFLGNYRRYCVRVIETISQDRPLELLKYLLQQTLQTFSTIEELSEYSKNAIPVVQVDANLIAVRSAVNGFAKWADSKRHLQSSGRLDAQARTEYEQSEAALENECNLLLQRTTTHPLVARIRSRIILEIIVHTPNASKAFLMNLITNILNITVDSSNRSHDYVEAIKAFHLERVSDVQRLAIGFPDQLWDSIGLLTEALMNDETLEDKARWGYRAIPLILMLDLTLFQPISSLSTALTNLHSQRTSLIDEDSRLPRLKTIFEPIANGWTDQQLGRQLESFSGFCSITNVDHLAEFIIAARFNSIENWSNTPLNEQGRKMQDAIEGGLRKLPFRMTTTLLSASSENLRPNTPASNVAIQIWSQLIPVILPNILWMLRHATGFATERNWQNHPKEVFLTLQKMMVDRFWQSGISNETREDFTARISGTVRTLEGFASTVRGMPRQIRDSCYFMLHGMARFHDTFYNIRELAQPLAEALLMDADTMSTHHLQRLVALIDRLVDRCPRSSWDWFLPPLLSLAFSKLGHKIMKDWKAIEASRTEEVVDGQSDQLGDEMKNDSIVRATSYSIVTFAHKLLCPQGGYSLNSWNPNDTKRSPPLRNLLINDESTLSPILEFLTAALAIQDTRCVTFITQIIRSLIPLFLPPKQSSTPTSPTTSSDPSDNPPPKNPPSALPQMNPDLQHFARNHIATSTFQTALTSLHEPYFVDIQRELASLLSSIIHYYSPHTDNAPGRILLTISSLDPNKVEQAVGRIVNSQRSGSGEKEQRGVVLDLLEGIKGVRVSEVGKVAFGDRKSDRAKRGWSQYGNGNGSNGGMDVETNVNKIQRGGTPPEGGLDGMFGP